MNTFKSIVQDENKNIVDPEYLISIFEISKGSHYITKCEDFLKKVNYGITEDLDSVSYHNDRQIVGFFSEYEYFLAQ